MEEYIRTINKLLGQSEELRPAVQGAVKAIISYGPEIYELVEIMGHGVVDLTASSIKRYQKQHGFTKEEAILLTLDTKYALEKMSKNSKRNK